jgi:hypothetical protein
MLNIRQHFEVEREDLSAIDIYMSYGTDVIDNTISALQDVIYIDRLYASLTFKTFVELEEILQRETNHAERIIKCIIYFYDFKEDISYEDAVKAIEALPAGVCLKLFDDFYEQRDAFINTRYKDVLYSNKKSDNKQEESESFESKFYKAFGFYDLKYTLSKEFSISFFEVDNVNIMDCFNHMAYMKYKNKVEEINRNKRG